MSARLRCPALIPVVTAALVLGPPAASAQNLPGEGDRVRVRMAGGSERTGLVSAFDPAGSLVLVDEASGREVSLPLHDVAGLEQSLGKGRRFGRNLGYTIAATSLTFGVLGAVSWSECTGWCLLHPESRADAFAWGLVGGAVVGLPIGVIVGLAVTSERWASVDLPAVTERSVHFTPILGPRTGLAVSVR